MHASHRPQAQALAIDVMRPSEVLGRPAPATDDPRRWLRVVLQALLALANVAAAATLLAVALR
jgi:hypothetical protein